MASNGAISEDLYLELYELSSDMGHYLEPGGDQKWYLPEALVSSLATTLLLSVLKAVFGEACKDLYKYVKDIVVNGKNLKQGDAEKLIDAANNSGLALTPQVDYAKAEELVAKELNESGFSLATSKIMASKSIQALRAQMKIDGRVLG